MPLLASDLYASSQGFKNDGRERCHWCGGACGRKYIHDEPPPKYVTKLTVVNGKVVSEGKTTAMHPGEPWVCSGCWLWRRKRISVVYLDGKITDLQCPLGLSWLVTERRAFGIRDVGFGKLYEFLLAPPQRFFVALLREGFDKPNELHRAVANDVAGEVTVGTPLAVNIDNVTFSYTPYELEEALRNGTAGKEPGVQEIIRTLGPFRLPPKPDPMVEYRKDHPRGGKPPEQPDARQTLRKNVGEK